MPKCRDGARAEKIVNGYGFTVGNEPVYSAGYVLYMAGFLIGSVMEGWRHDFQ
jgi:hypothetical protein